MMPRSLKGPDRPSRLNRYSDAPTCGDLTGTTCRTSVFTGGLWQVATSTEAAGIQTRRLWPTVWPGSASTLVRFCASCGAQLIIQQHQGGQVAVAIVREAKP